MKKVKLRDIRMGEIFSRIRDGYSYIKAGGVVPSAGGDLPVCYCLDSGNEYPWMADEEVYLQYREGGAMRLPEERGVILSKIMEMAAEGKTFGLIPLILRWMGKHYDTDWQLCLDELVEAGELTVRGKTYSPRKEEQVKDKKYYKGFRVVDGELVSLVDWCGCKVEPEDDYIPEVLTYKEGQITYSPEGTQGIFFEKTLQSAKDITNANGAHRHKVVHEVTPLGEQGIGWNGRQVCPAVLVGKYVCGFSEPTVDEPEPEPEEGRPEPKFKVGDEVIGVSSYAKGKEKSKIDRVFWAKDEGYDCATSDWLYVIDGWNYGEEMLELAPKEEMWEDITEDCKAESLRHSMVGCALVNISYHGKCVAMLGINGVEMSEAMSQGEYALAEDVTPTAQGTIWFSILRRLE